MIEGELDTRSSGTAPSGAAAGAAPRSDLPVGSSAGEYVVTGLLARGGCGSVYRARHATAVDRHAAVKVLHAPLAVLPKMVERFKREVEVVGMLRHPNIVEIYEVGALGDRRPFYAMELLPGRTLAAIIEEEGRMAPSDALAVLEPVCAALSAAHAAGVIHRDVKASNIMVGDGRATSVKLLDFGIAKLVGPPDGSGALVSLTTDGRQVGTLTIMAPEQLLGGPVDARIDIYALGILLYRLLTGRLPFDGKNALALAQQHLEEPAPRPSHRIPLAPALDTLVLRCLEKRPERRYASVAELLDALRSAVPGAGRHDPAPAGGAPAPGVGIYLEVRMRADDLDDALGDDIGFILDLAEDELRTEGFALAFVTGNSVLGVRALPADPAASLAARAAALETALGLHEKVSTRAGADPRVHANVCVHVDDVALRASGRREVVGGPLIRAQAWAPLGDVLALCATEPAVEALTGFDLVAGPAYGEGSPPALVTVARSITMGGPESPPKPPGDVDWGR
jgi:eukaryotic-like serine/threonine-protein kinase